MARQHLGNGGRRRGYKTCPTCDGSGETPDGDDCPTCGGSGEVPEDEAAHARFGAIAIKHTATSDGSWDGPANEARLPSGEGTTAAKLRPAYAWVDPAADETKKAAYSFIHHEIDSDGKIGPANTTACSSGIGVLNGGRGGSSSADWWKDRRGIFRHLVGHLKDAGVKGDDLPKLKDMAAMADTTTDHDHGDPVPLEGDMADHGALDVTHSHSHPAYGTQGGDETHSHKHTHHGDAFHDHHQAAAAVDNSERLAELRALLEADEPLMAAAWGARWDPEARDDHWQNPDFSFGRKGAFVLDESLVADGGQLVDNPGAAWHAYLCVEGVRTDEDLGMGIMGRELMPGACQWPDLPVSLRITIQDEGGHYGAISCGRIDTMDRVQVDLEGGGGYTAIYATGVFGSDHHGQLAQLMVTEQTQRFVSIDPRDYTAEIVEKGSTKVTPVDEYIGGMFDDDDGPEPDGDETDKWMRFSSLVIGAATIVPTPALQQAVITLAGVDLPTAPLATERSPSAVVASGATIEPPVAPPLEWFADPSFHVGDPRLVRQPDGRYACPSTVTDDGRVFGHACYWGQQHTGYSKPMPPPRSTTYAHYMTGSVRTAEGEDVAVGQITMGIGHASTDKPAPVAKAHYDGGYGAVQMADVRVGEDDFGIWFAGALRPLKSEDNPDGITQEQIRQFRAMDLSPDWRPISGSLHMLAVLSVPVGGFPVAREEALVAAGFDPAEEILDPFVHYGVDANGRITGLVAAGKVQRIPAGERLARLEHLVDVLAADLAQREAGSRAALLSELRTFMAEDAMAAEAAQRRQYHERRLNQLREMAKV